MSYAIPEKLEPYRVMSGEYASLPREPFGAFAIQGPCGEKLVIMASEGLTSGWEHVSVSTRRRTPNWQEMCWVKNWFWQPEDCVIEFHPPQSEYVNCHPFCLHLWRPVDGKFPMPPSILVGPKKKAPAQAGGG